jgi:hypothetical protein
MTVLAELKQTPGTNRYFWEACGFKSMEFGEGESEINLEYFNWVLNLPVEGTVQ